MSKTNVRVDAQRPQSQKRQTLREILLGTESVYALAAGVGSGLTSNWNNRPSRRNRRGIAQAGLAHCVMAEVRVQHTDSRLSVSHARSAFGNRVKNVFVEAFRRALESVADG